MKSTLFVQANVAVNINLTQATYVVNSILTSKAPFLCPKHITICPTTGFIVAIKFMLLNCACVMTTSRLGPLVSLWFWHSSSRYLIFRCPLIFYLKVPLQAGAP